MQHCLTFNTFERELHQQLQAAIDASDCSWEEIIVALTSSLFRYIFCRWANWPRTVEGVIECLQDHQGTNRLPLFRTTTIWQVPGS